jgi:hypothetical protein
MHADYFKNVFVLQLLGNQQTTSHELGDPFFIYSVSHVGIGHVYSSCWSTKLPGAWYLGCVTQLMLICFSVQTHGNIVTLLEDYRLLYPSG